jgi:RNA polymerase sigma-70 factor (ECF subfamily)
MQYKTDVYYYLISLTHDATLSEDLLSETFLKAIHSLPTFKNNSSIKTWLFGIARNLWLQHLRNLKPQVEYNDLLGLYIAEAIEDQLITKQATDRITELLKSKEERTQKIINMRVDGLSYSEIAQTLNISESSARVIEFRTKKWLKATLEQEGLM